MRGIAFEAPNENSRADCRPYGESDDWHKSIPGLLLFQSADKLEVGAGAAVRAWLLGSWQVAPAAAQPLTAA